MAGSAHFVGSFFLFAACILLLVASITAPVVDHLALLKVNLANATDSQESALIFGTFGYCTINTLSGDNACSHSHLGYSPVAALVSAGAVESSDDSSSTDSTNSITDLFSSTETKVIRNLTKVMILHPICTGIAFLACILGLAAGICGSFMGSLAGIICFLATLLILVIDFVLFAIVRNKVNNDDNDTGATAAFGSAIWTVLASAICSLLGTLILCLTCCCGGGRRRDRDPMMPDKMEGAAAIPSTGRFFFRR